MKDGAQQIPSEFRIAVLGVGHIGLPTALAFAEMGAHVTAADVDAEKIASMAAGHCPFYEPGLQELLTRHIANPKLRFSSNLQESIRWANVLFICVGTPQLESGEADVSIVESLARLIAHNLNDYKLIVEKSTVPAITGQWIKRTIARHIPHTNGDGIPQFDVASNPEFLQEGRALEDFFQPERIVCGVETENARCILNAIYAPLNAPLVFTDINTAELIKHTANAFLAMKVSFINVVADICEAVGADVDDVAKAIGLDRRIGPAFLNAGIGFGGYCLPKDLKAYIHLAERKGVHVNLLREVERVNVQRTTQFVRRVRDALWILRGKKIAVLGLAFKPHTDDVREAPSLRIIDELLREGAIVRACDPEAAENACAVRPEIPGRLSYIDDPYEAAQGANAVLITTEWEMFRNLNLTRLRHCVETPVVVDGRNIFDPERMHRAGFEYHSIGRSTVPAQPHVVPMSATAVAAVTKMAS